MTTPNLEPLRAASIGSPRRGMTSLSLASMGAAIAIAAMGAPAAARSPFKQISSRVRNTVTDDGDVIAAAQAKRDRKAAKRLADAARKAASDL